MIVNIGNATAKDILSVMQHVRSTVYKKTGITLEVEPQFIGFTKEELSKYFTI